MSPAGQITLEAYLARLYTDAVARETFLSDAEAAARAAGLGEDDIDSLKTIDRAGLRMAAESYASKRAHHKRPKSSLGQRLLAGARAALKPRQGQEVAGQGVPRYSQIYDVSVTGRPVSPLPSAANPRRVLLLLGRLPGGGSLVSRNTALILS